MPILIEPQRTMWDLNWSMFKIPVRVNPLFWLTALALSYFEKLPFPFVMIGVACIFVSILVHEFGHALSNIYYGEKNLSVVLYTLGGLCIGGHLERWPRISVLLWGPGAGFVLGGTAFVTGGLLYGWDWLVADIGPHSNIYVLYTLSKMIWINLIWGAMNLMPVFPLDGGQITREILRWKRPAKGDRLAFTISIVTAVLIALAGAVLNQLFVAIMFGWLAYQSIELRRHIDQFGDLERDEDTGPRQPWEQDADWWKKG